MAFWFVHLTIKTSPDDLASVWFESEINVIIVVFVKYINIIAPPLQMSLTSLHSTCLHVYKRFQICFSVPFITNVWSKSSKQISLALVSPFGLIIPFTYLCQIGFEWNNNNCYHYLYWMEENPPRMKTGNVP